MLEYSRNARKEKVCRGVCAHSRNACKKKMLEQKKCWNTVDMLLEQCRQQGTKAAKSSQQQPAAAASSKEVLEHSRNALLEHNTASKSV